MKLKINNHLKRSNGFTIVELMIALSVLAVLLLVCTMTLINLGKTYIKGNNEAQTQNVARNIINGVASQLQLGAAAPIFGGNGGSGNGNTVCIGTTRYTYLLGEQVEPGSGLPSGQTNHALWQDTMKTGNSCPVFNSASMQTPNPTSNASPPSVPGSGQELIPQNMRLTAFSIVPEPNSGLYQIKVGVAYGDSDLLCDRGRAQDCSQSWINQNIVRHIQNLESPVGQIGCTGYIGQQFCAVSNLSVTVAHRVPNE